MLQHCIPTPVSLRPLLPKTQSALIGQLTHGRASTAHHVSCRLWHVFKNWPSLPTDKVRRGFTEDQFITSFFLSFLKEIKSRIYTFSFCVSVWKLTAMQEVYISIAIILSRAPHLSGPPLWWCNVSSRNHGFKGETSDEVFQERGFLWERGDSVGADFGLFNFRAL